MSEWLTWDNLVMAVSIISAVGVALFILTDFCGGGARSKEAREYDKVLGTLRAEVEVLKANDRRVKDWEGISVEDVVKRTTNADGDVDPKAIAEAILMLSKHIGNLELRAALLEMRDL